MDLLEIPIVDKEIKTPNIIGLTIYKSIYIDYNKLKYFSDEMKIFILFHEIAHFKSIQKQGFELVVSKLSSSDLNELCNHVINEEILADRYASRIFFKYFNKIYPKHQTQNLELDINKTIYKSLIKLFMFNKIKDEKSLLEHQERIINGTIN